MPAIVPPSQRTSSAALCGLLQLEDPRDYKVHLACFNQRDKPLDVFVRSREEWRGWNEYRGSKDDFTRPFILSLIDFHHEPDRWLFGGIWRVKERKPDRYVIEPDGASAEFVGRLKLAMKRPGRAKAVYLDRYLDQLRIDQVLPEPFTGRAFPGFARISHSFEEIAAVITNNRADWRGALQNVKGVYLLADGSNGKLYVGSAYGNAGVWSRWSCYVATGHGWNDRLTQLIAEKGRDHARRHFRLTLLEHFPMNVADADVIGREQFWKDALLSRTFGHNAN